jgi:hypothetical protein
MKKLFVFAITAVLLSSCGAEQTAADKMAGEFCSAIEAFNPDDPDSGLEFFNKMTTIGSNSEYEGVSDTQLEEALASSCPDGYKKLEELMQMAQ